jgi:hypothetical protein
MEKITGAELASELAHCCGTEGYTRFGINPRVLCTDGAKLMADLVGAYWLLDAIASYQTKKLDQECDGMQFWKLIPNGKGCTLICQKDSGEPELVRQEIEYTDFPFDGDKPFDLWVEGDHNRQIILLPGEH